MADIAKIKLPDGVTYDIKDATARSAIASLNNWEYVLSSTAQTTPSGVTWHNSGQLVTGTLVASSNTMYKIYLVSDIPRSGTDTFEEYITVAITAGTYRWEKLGKVDVDLSGYAQYGDPVSVSGTAANHTAGISAKVPAASFSPIYPVSGSTFLSASYVTLGTAFSVPNVTNKGSGSFTQGTFNAGTLPSATYDATNELLTLTVGTLPSHGADSHTHTAPTLGTKFTIPNVTGVDLVQVPQLDGATLYVLSSGTTASDVTVTVTDSGHTHTVSATGTIDTPST